MSALSPTGRHIPRVLSIAGTDPTGGAGIHADLKSIGANGGYGMAVITAVVAQNTRGVRSVHALDVDVVTAQLDAVSDDVRIDAVKIGMLFDTAIIAAVREWLIRSAPPIVVLDPVMVSTSGDRLLEPDAESLLRELLERVDLVTPNLPELAVLLGEEPAVTWAEARDQAVRLSRRHRVRVLAKGGHLAGDSVPDALIDATGDGEPTIDEYVAERIATTSTHGTGCSLSAAIATLQPRTGSWSRATESAKTWLTGSIRAAAALDVGTGNGPVSHFAALWALEDAARAGEAGGDREAAESDAPAPVPTLTPAGIADDWWADVTGIRAAIDDLSFVRGLRDGTLDEQQFRWYLHQDALYLRDFARALATASALAPTADEQAFWAEGAHGAIAAEVDLHASWIGADALFDAEPSETTRGYVDHLLAASARADYGELVAAVLPCFWIYTDVGRRLLAEADPSGRYASWIGTYGDEEFAAATRRAITLVTEHAARSDAAGRARMRGAFRRSCEWERRFFDAPAHLSRA